MCCLQNTQCHHEQQAGKTCATEGWQHLPPEKLSVLKSLGNRGVVTWDHCCLKDRLESNTWGSEPQQFTARPVPLVLGMGNMVPSSQSVCAHKHPYGPSTALCCEMGKRTRGCIEPDLVLPTVVGGTYKAHQATLLVTSVGTKCSSVFSLLSIPHIEQSLCVLHTP